MTATFYSPGQNSLPFSQSPYKTLAATKLDRLAVTLTSPLAQPGILPDVSQLRRNQGQFFATKLTLSMQSTFAASNVSAEKRGTFVARKLTLSMQSTFATSNVSAETRGSFVATKLTLSMHSRHLLLQTCPQKPGAVLSQQSSRFGLGVRR